MSSAKAKETECFTLTWKIENIGLFLPTAKSRWLNCPVFKTVTTKGNEFWQLSISNGLDTKFSIILERLKECQIIEKCEMSIMTKSGDVLLDCSCIDKDFYAYIDKKSLCNEYLVLSEDTMTINCKLWFPFQESEVRVNRTVLYKDNLFWNVKNRLGEQKTVLEMNSLLFGIILKNEKIKTKNKMLVVSVLPNKDGCPFFVDYKLLIKDDQGRVKKLQSSWPYVRWDANLTVTDENASNYVELQMDCIVAVHVNFPGLLPQTNSLRASEAVSRFSGTLSDDLSLLYREGMLSDVTLSTEEKSFSAHRNILSARSPVFRAMFEKGEMSEARDGVVDIDDVDSETVDRMLVFLYGDSLEGVQWEEASALYYAADKYAVLPLKQKCADILKAGLTVDNACDALFLADKHSDQELMKCVVDFLHHHKEVISSVRWEELEESNSRLTSKITRYILLKKEQTR